MNNEQLKERIQSIEPTAEIIEGPQYLTVTVAPAKFHAFALKLCQADDLLFDFLFCLTGMDYGDSFGVIYHLESTTFRHEVVLKTSTTDRENSILETVCDIWKTAEFLEREVYDLFGIFFKNHPDMRRIFLDEDWEGHPLRKDYTDNNTLVK